MRYLQLQDEFVERIKRINDLAFLLSILAITSKQDHPSEYLLTYKALFTQKEISDVFNDKELTAKFKWIMLHLSKEMIQDIQLTHLSHNMNFNADYVDRFYKKAQELAQQYEQTPHWQRIQQTHLNADLIFKRLHSLFFLFEDKYNFLRNNSSMFAGNRFVKEMFPDHIMGVGLMAGLLGRGSTEIGHFHERVYDAGSAWGLSSVGMSDTLQNISAHGTIGGALISLSLRQDIDKITEYFQKEVIPTYTPELPEIEREQKFFEYLFSQAKALVSFGEKDNFGVILRKRELSQLALWQVLLLTVILPRWASGELTFGQAVMSSIIYNAAALLLYRWPWSWILSGASMNANGLFRNYTNLRKIQIHFSELEKGILIQSEQEYREKYRQTLNNLIQLYKNKRSPKLIKLLEYTISDMENSQIAQFVENRNFSEEDIQKLSVQSSIEEIAQASRRFINAISQEPPLPTKANTPVDWFFTTSAGPILTTIMAIELLIRTFNTDKLTTGEMTLWISAWLGAIGVSHLWNRSLWKDKKLEWWEKTENKQIKQSWANLTGIRPFLEDKQAAFQRLKKPHKTSAKPPLSLKNQAGKIELLSPKNSKPRAFFQRSKADTKPQPSSTNPTGKTNSSSDSSLSQRLSSSCKNIVRRLKR